MIARLLQSIALVLVVALIAGCAEPVVQHRSINAAFDVNVNDPEIRLLTGITANIELVATGEFNPGNYVVNNKTLTFDPGTKFRLKLSLPIDDPDVIHTANAKGSLFTSQQFRVNDMPIPQVVELSKGTVRAEVDLVRSLGAFFIGFLQKGSNVGDVHQIISSLHVEQAQFDLRPDSYLNVGGQQLHIGANSAVSLTDVIVAPDFSYSGDCHMDIKFLNGCKWVTRRASCEFDGGSALLDLAAHNVNDRLTLTLKKQKRLHNLITLEKPNFHFGKSGRSSARSDVVTQIPSELKWEFIKGAPHPHLHMLSSLEMKQTTLDIKSDVQETIAELAEMVPASLEVDQDDSGVSTEFATGESVAAKSARIVIAKKATSLTIWLTDAIIGPASVDRSGAFHFSLDRGSAHLKQLDWVGKSRKFTLATNGGAQVSIPDGMLLETAAAGGPTELNMPLEVKLGTATIKGAKGATTLNDLTGQLLIKVQNEVQITGDLGFSLPKSSFLNGQPMDIKAHGLNLEVAHGGAVLELKKCSVMVPQGAVQEAINRKVPDNMTLDIDKIILDNEKWRYRNAIAKKVMLTNLHLERMQPNPPNGVTFTAIADVDLEGTIEQEKAKKPGEEVRAWETRPWKLFGHLEGDGSVKYRFVAQEGNMENQVAYDLTMSLPVPSDVKLDWSQVAKGILGFVERKAIVNHLRKITIPIKYSGKVAIFPEDNPLVRNFKVTGLVARHTSDATQLDFVAEARF